MTKVWSILNQNNQIWQIDGVDVLPLAKQFGTPLYLYSARFIRERLENYFQGAGGKKIALHYAIKANNNLSILKRIAITGAGFDIVSRGELERVLLAGGAAEKIVFSGVGKTDDEIRRALEVGIGCFNVESAPELTRLAEIAAEMGKVAPFALRVNPNVDAQTHPYISTGMKENKFGVALELVPELYQWAKTQPSLKTVGVGCHIGSQITTLSPFLEAADSLFNLSDQLVSAGIEIKNVDIGGGLGIATAEKPDVPEPAELVAALLEKLGERPYQLHLQPGRSIVGNAGILLSEVIFHKNQAGREFLIIDAAMNDYIRPALYQAIPAMKNLSRTSDGEILSDVVGPVCESGDTFAKQYPITGERGDVIALAGVGAYGFAMSSTYNSRPRPAEVLIEDGKAILIRDRETLAKQWQEEVEALEK